MTDRTIAAGGETGKLAAHALLEARREVYILRGRRALLLRLLDAGEATADDVRDAVALPAGIDPKVFGVVPGLLAKARIIERAGYAESRRPDAHARPLSIWRLTDRVGALAWLDAHPDRPDPTPAEMQSALSLFDPPKNTARRRGNVERARKTRGYF